MSSDTPPVATFVSSPAVHGFLNGVVNMSFTTARYVAKQDGDKVRVEMEFPVTVDLRMDLMCATQVRDILTTIIEQNTKPPMGDVAGSA